MLCRLALPLLMLSSSGLLAAQDIPAVAPAMPAVQALPDPTVYAVVIIPELHRGIDRLQSLVNALTPAGIPPPSMMDGIGPGLNDPQLKNLASSPALLVVTTGVPVPGIVCILPCIKPQDYVDPLVADGLAAKVVGSLAVISQTPATLDLALPIAEHYAAVTANLPACDARVLLSPARLTAAYGPMLTMMSKTMLPIPAPQKAIFGAEIAAIMSMAADLDEVQVDCTLAQNSLQVTQVLVAKPGSALAKAMASSSPHHPGAVSHLENRQSLIAVSGHFNIEAFGGYVNTLLHSLSADPALQAALSPALFSSLDACVKSQNGDLALQVLPRTGGWFLLSEIIGSTDTAKLMAAQTDMINAMSAKNGLSQTLGSHNSMQTGVRSVGGVSIDRLTTSMDPSKLPAGAAPNQAALNALFTPTEMAQVNGFLMVSQEPANLDAMITGKATGITLKAQGQCGPGMDGYWDADLPGLIAAFSALSVPAAAIKLPAPTEPMTGCWIVADGKTMTQTHLPVATMVAVSVMIQNAMAQMVPQHRGPRAGGAGAAGEAGKTPPAVF